MTLDDYAQQAPGVVRALRALGSAVDESGLDKALSELLKIRVSQINGCAHCIDMHSRELRKTMSVDKITLVPVWDEVAHLFTDQERAALAWSEEVTRVSETHASDEAYAAAAAAFSPKDLVDLTIAIAAMNAFNRLGAPFRVPVAAVA